MGRATEAFDYINNRIPDTSLYASLHISQRVKDVRSEYRKDIYDITSGKWRIDKDDSGSTFIFADKFKLAEVGTFKGCKDNGRIMVEAANIYNKYNLSPKQLIDRNKELLRVLAKAHDLLNYDVATQEEMDEIFKTITDNERV